MDEARPTRAGRRHKSAVPERIAQDPDEGVRRSHCAPQPGGLPHIRFAYLVGSTNTQGCGSHFDPSGSRR